MELETRECRCGLKFKCLASSPQQFHSRNCQVRYEKISFGWTRASREKRKKGELDIKTHITTAITSDLNVKQIRIGLPDTENIKRNMPEEKGLPILRSTEFRVGNTRLATERKEMNESEDLEAVPPISNIENDDENDLENLDDYTPRNTERPSRIGMISTIQQQRSIHRQGISEKEFYHSKSLVDESIGQLQELTKLCVTSLHSQEAKLRDPQMVNAAVNSAKAVTELIKIKLNAAKSLTP